MSIQLSIQILLWFFAAIASALAITQYYVFRKKELRLPAACELEDLEARVDQKRNALNESSNELIRAREIIGEATQKQAELTELRNWFHQHKEELVKMESERKQQEALRAQLQILRDEKQAAAAEIERLQSSLKAELVKLRSEKGTVLTELEGIQRERASELANVTNLATQRANLLAEIAQTKSDLKDTKQELQDRNLERNILQNELNLKSADLKRVEELLETTGKMQEIGKKKLEEIIAKTDAEKRRLVEMETSHHALVQQCERLKVEIGDLQKWKETLLAMLSRLQAEVDRMDPQAATEDRYRDLWEPLQFPTLSLARAALPENEALTETEAYFKSHDLIYPKRVLHAFHTALKTADLSPLTVLAGISGTGKSLLPKRYAEAMGIHQVTLAVQPRWDSPQDLFGFFNHLEKRFKATELARAMVQFERHNRDDWALPKGWNHGRQDGMLLVLLDEMNLARVEYYFSEFLSRLETRRDVNDKDRFDRAKAEILLDMGSLRKDESPIRLYPSRNILFTGTMNEDESTQTLSDKVVDRACVLRFGRPKQLERRVAQSKAKTPREEGLALKHWMAWCQNRLPASDLQKLNDWIGNLNDGMDTLGKPFAHRVHQAIISYAANYPRIQGSEHLKLALADQIEQRILPKLRGIELEGNEDGLRKLEKVIEAADDGPLLNAFRRGMDSRSGTFLWRGLDRGEG